jgi:hypothetical protein
MLVFAIQDGGVRYAWKSAAIIIPFVVSGMCWIVFGIWEVLLWRRGLSTTTKPLFPIHLIKNRIVGAALV